MVLRERDGVRLCKEVRDNGAECYVVYGKDATLATTSISIRDNKEKSYMRALSVYLAELDEVEFSYDFLLSQLNNQFFTYDRLLLIAKNAIKALPDGIKREFVDELSEDEQEELDCVDKPYEIREYTVKLIQSTKVQIAVKEDADDCDIESELESYCDDLNSCDWEFEEYEVDFDYDDMGNPHRYTESDAEYMADTVLYN